MDREILTDWQGLVEIMSGIMGSELRRFGFDADRRFFTIDLEGLLSVLGDRRFDLEQFQLDEPSREASLFLADDRDARGIRKRLKITGVKSASIPDNAQIQLFSFEDLRIGESSVTLVGIESLEIVLTVGEGCALYLLHDAPPEAFAAFEAFAAERQNRPNPIGTALRRLLRQDRSE